MNGIQKGIKIFAIILGIVIIANIFGWMLFGISSFVYITGNNPKVSTGEMQAITESNYQNINKLKIELIAANLTIKLGEELRVEAEDLNDNFSVKTSGDTLKIEEHTVFWNKSKISNMIIYIPGNLNLRDLRIETGAGSVSVEEIKAEKLNLDQGAGRLEITNSEFKETDIDGGAGETKISRSILNDLDLDAGVGRVEIQGEIIGNSKINCGIGEMNLKLSGSKESYKIIAEKGIGSIKIDGNSQGNDTTYGNGENRIRLERWNRKHKSRV